MKAGIVNQYIVIRADYRLSDCRVLETDCMRYDAYLGLPRVVERTGVLFGLTGWNSDRGVAYYKDTAMLGQAVKWPSDDAMAHERERREFAEEETDCPDCGSKSSEEGAVCGCMWCVKDLRRLG